MRLFQKSSLFFDKIIKTDVRKSTELLENSID